MSEVVPPDAEVKIDVQEVTKSFVVAPGQSPALEGVSFDVKRGEFLALLGPSGCGKSTLLSLIAGLQDPTSGNIMMDAEVINGPSPRRGVLFQDYALFPWKSVTKNVEFGLRYGPRAKRLSAGKRRELVSNYVNMVGLQGSEDKYPGELSGGMRQRTALARLWAPDPDVLLMDEPLSALDAQTRIVMQDELLRIWGQQGTNNERKTVVYVTHSIDEAVFLADRVVVMASKPGRVKEIIDIDIPRPRSAESRTSPKFEEFHAQIWDLIRDEAYQATLNNPT